MKKLFLFLALILSVNLAWGETKTVTYTVTSTTSVNKSGDVPEGSSATFENTYTTKDQLTKGNSMTLTLTGFQGLKITGLTMKMHSNKSAGTGQFSLKAGSTEIAGIASNTGFNQQLWNGAWTQEYVDIAFTLINSNYIIKENEKVVLTISASANSLFCNTITLTYEESSSTSISADNVDLDYNATSGEIDYTINNPVTGTTLSAETTTEWITNVAVNNNDNKVTFTTTANNTTSPRNGTITLSYEGANDKVITVTQAAAPYSTIAGIFEQATAVGKTATDINITFNNWVVSGVKGSNAYVTDRINGFIVYGSGHGFEVGDKLSGTVACKVQLYNGSAELTSLTSETTGLTVTKGGTITPNTEISIADLSGVNTGTVISYSNLTYNGTAFTDGTNIIKPYTSIMSTLPTLTNGKKYNVTGVYVQFNSDKEIAPRTAEDIVEVEATKYNITIDNMENGTVEASETTAAEGVEITLTINPATGYKLSTISATNGNETFPIVENKFTMPASDVTVSATFTEKSQHYVMYTVFGEEFGEGEDVYDGEFITMSEIPTAPQGWTFAGWTLNDEYETSTTAPVMFTNQTPVTEDLILYAVFSKTIEGESGSATLSHDEILTISGSYTTGSITNDFGTWNYNAAKQGNVNKDGIYFLQLRNNVEISYLQIPQLNGNITSIVLEDVCNTSKAKYTGNIYFRTECDNAADAIVTETASTALEDITLNIPDGYSTGYIMVSGACRIYSVTVNYSNSTTTYTTTAIPEIKLFEYNSEAEEGEELEAILKTVDFGTCKAGNASTENPITGFKHITVQYPGGHLENIAWSLSENPAPYELAAEPLNTTLFEKDGRYSIRINIVITEAVTADTNVAYEGVKLTVYDKENSFVTPVVVDLIAAGSKAVASQGEGTSLENASVSENVQKIMREGQILIIRDGITYSVDGRVVE